MPSELITLDTEVGNQDAGPADDSAVPGYIPEGWKTVEEFLQHVRDEFAADAGYDRDNRDKALEDLKFLAGDQWDPQVRSARESKGRPCLTINVLPQFVGQVIGDRRLNKTAVRVAPKKDGTMEEAQVRSGIIKGIEEQSRADRVYDAACEDQVGCGIGNFRIDLEYAGNDVFDQDIIIRHIPNPLAVVWDRMSVDPTGRDARHCFVQDIMPRKIYDKRFPDHPAPSELGDQGMTGGVDAGWFDKDIVRITEFWELVDKPATFALMADGDVKDVTGKDPAEYEEELWRDETTGKPRIRKSYRTYARMHLVSGFAILSEAYEIPLTRLPIIKVEGRVIRVGDDRVRFGLVRYSKDSQRLKNYWRSVAAETLALAPKAQWTASEDSVEGREDEWRKGHITGDPLLIHNKNTDPPQRVDPPTVPAALLQEAQMNQQDIKDTTGLQDASLGMRSNEISGRAIQARQTEGDVATIIYHDNLNASILEGGDVINQLLPLAYDTVRQVLVIGEDDKRTLMKINDPHDENSPAIGTGKYSVSLETGPSFSTQRAEARDAMTTLVQTAPDLFTVAGDLLVKNMDWPGAFEISERLKKQMQKQGIVEQDEGEVTPEQQAAAQQAAQMQQMQEQLAQAQIQLQQESLQLEQQKLMAEAAKLEHEERMRQLELQRAVVEAQPKDEQDDPFEMRVADANARAAEARARQAEAQAEMAEADAQLSPVERVHKMHLAERTASAKRDQNNRGAGPRPGGDRPKGRTKKEQKK